MPTTPSARAKKPVKQEVFEFDDSSDEDVKPVPTSAKKRPRQVDSPEEKKPAKKRSSIASSSTPKAKPKPKRVTHNDDDDFEMKGASSSSDEAPQAVDTSSEGDDPVPSKRNTSSKSKADTRIEPMYGKLELNKFNFDRAQSIMKRKKIHLDEMPDQIRYALNQCRVSFTGTAVHERAELVSLVEREGGSVDGKPTEETDFIVTGADVTENKLEYMRKKGIKSVTEQQLFMLIRFWANDEMYEEPDVAPTKTSKVVSTPSKETTKPRKGISATQRAAGIADLFNFEAAAKRREKEGVDALDIPSGQDNCLSGLTIVFTGELEKMSRDESTELAKRLGAKVTTGPSGQTSYVVMGEGAGPSKLKKIKELGVPSISEIEFFDLIRYRPVGGKLTEKQKEAQQKAEKAMKDEAARMLKEEADAEKARARKEKVAEREGVAAKTGPALSSQLWTTKYAPKTLKEICGNKGSVEKLGQWLEQWPKSYKEGFKKPGKDGMGQFRAILISGPPGIGKTTSAHLVAKLKGYSPIELNASDSRSKKLVQNATNVDNSSLDGWFEGGLLKQESAAGLKINARSCLIMDEVDGMSGGDRGGVGAMNILIKKTKIPMILICNDSSTPKMKPLQTTTYSMKFRRPTATEVRARLMTIAFKEGLKVDGQVLDGLIQSSQSDLRSVLNMLSTWKLSKNVMSFDEGKQLGKESEKYTIMTPFTITPALIGPYAFSKTNRETLNDKLDYYFQDFSFVPLFVQENYLKNAPSRAGRGDDPDTQMKRLDLISKAADAISDGDLIDRMIHGQEQHWSLLPAHGMNSCVRPAYWIYGPSEQTGYSPVSFPAFLGQNSKRQKLARLLGDIQIKMRLKVSGSRDEVRQDYMPLLASKIVLPMTRKEEAAEAPEHIIPYLDEYYLNKEDWDAFVELGVGEMNEKTILGKIPAATKASFTRAYNKGEHPVAFHRGELLFAGKKGTAVKPDLDEAFGDDDEGLDDIAGGEANDDEAEGPDPNADLGKDKLIKMPKVKKEPKVKKTDEKPKAVKARSKA